MFCCPLESSRGSVLGLLPLLGHQEGSVLGSVAPWIIKGECVGFVASWIVKNRVWWVFEILSVEVI